MAAGLSAALGEMGQRDGSKAVRWEREWGRGLLWREGEACARASSEWGRSSGSGRKDGGVGQNMEQRGANGARLQLCARATTRGKARLQLGEGNPAGYALRARG